MTRSRLDDGRAVDESAYRGSARCVKTRDAGCSPCPTRGLNLDTAVTTFVVHEHQT